MKVQPLPRLRLPPSGWHGLNGTLALGSCWTLVELSPGSKIPLIFIVNSLQFLKCFLQVALFIISWVPYKITPPSWQARKLRHRELSWLIRDISLVVACVAQFLLQ